MSDSGVGVEPSRHHCPTCGGPHEHPDTGIGGACDKYFLGNARRSTQENIRRNQEREAERSGVWVDTDQARIEAAAKGAYEQHRDHSDEWPWGMVFERTQDGWRNFARIALAAADAVDPVRAEVSGLVGKLAEAEKERDAYHERFSAQMIAGSNLIAELAEANERFRSDGRLIEEIIGERDEALAQLAKIRELCDIVNHNYVEYKQTLRDVKTAYTKGVEDGVKSAMDRVAAVLGVPQPEPGNATETADGLHGAAENVTPVGVPQEQAPTDG